LRWIILCVILIPVLLKFHWLKLHWIILCVLFILTLFWASYEGEPPVVTKSISPSGEGKIRYKGREWDAISVDKRPIIAGSKVEILGIQGEKLYVRKAMNEKK